MSWYFLRLPALCCVAAFLELDDAHIGQVLLSRPFVAGTILGALTGSPGQGAFLGAILELLIIDDLPVGHRIPLNATIAAAVMILLSLGFSDVNPALSLPAGLLAGQLFRRVENRIRLRRADEARAVDEALSRGKKVPFGRILMRSLATQFCLVAAFLYVVIASLGPGLDTVWPLLPDAARAGARWAFEVAPWLGIATALNLLRPR